MARGATQQRASGAGVVVALVALVLGASSCDGSPEDFSGFQSSEECLLSMPVTRPDIRVDALADRCGTTIGMAEIALRAASAADVVEGRAGAVVAPSSTTTTAAVQPSTTTSSSSVVAPTTATEQQTVTTSVSSSTETIKGGVKVPDVIGLGHQQAQDVMQAIGLRNLSEVDATGEGRRLLWDRNWIVVEQIPLPGTVVEKGEEVILYSVKKDEILDEQ